MSGVCDCYAASEKETTGSQCCSDCTVLMKVETICDHACDPGGVAVGAVDVVRNMTLESRCRWQDTRKCDSVEKFHPVSL